MENDTLLRITDQTLLNELLESFHCSKKEGKQMIQTLQNGIDLNETAVYFVLRNSRPLMFFSLKCGQLYKAYDLDGRKAFIENNKEQYKECKDNGYGSRPDTQQYQFMTIYNIRIQDVERIEKERASNKFINCVKTTFSAVELVHFCKQEDIPVDAAHLFEEHAYPIIRRLPIGCRYVYLFAADDGSGNLIRYYKEKLGFDKSDIYCASKPKYDWGSTMMLREI